MSAETGGATSPELPVYTMLPGQRGDAVGDTTPQLESNLTFEDLTSFVDPHLLRAEDRRLLVRLTQLAVVAPRAVRSGLDLVGAPHEPQDAASRVKAIIELDQSNPPEKRKLSDPAIEALHAAQQARESRLEDRFAPGNGIRRHLLADITYRSLMNARNQAAHNRSDDYSAIHRRYTYYTMGSVICAAAVATSAASRDRVQ